MVYMHIFDAQNNLFVSYFKLKLKYILILFVYYDII